MRRFMLAGVVLAGAGLLGAVAQQPQPQPPPLPVINPALARPDGVLGGLAGPGFALTLDTVHGLLVAGCETGALHYWEADAMLGIRAGESAAHSLDAHVGPVTVVASGGGRVVSGGADGKLLVWDLPAGKILHTLPAGACVRAIDISPDGKQLASTAESGEVQLWDLATGKATSKLSGGTQWLLAVGYSPDGKLLAAGGHDGLLRVWEVTGKKLVEVKAQPPAVANQPAPPDNAITAVAFSPDGKMLAVGGTDTSIHLFQTADGKLLRSLPGHASSPSQLVFHPAGKVLISASRDRTLRLWDPASGQMLKALEGHGAWAQGVVLFSQATRLASVSADQTVRLWDLAEPKK